MHDIADKSLLVARSRDPQEEPRRVESIQRPRNARRRADRMSRSHQYHRHMHGIPRHQRQQPPVVLVVVVEVIVISGMRTGAGSVRDNDAGHERFSLCNLGYDARSPVVTSVRGGGFIASSCRSASTQLTTAA